MGIKQLVLFFLVLFQPAAAGEIHRARIEFSHGVYTLDIDAEIHANWQSVRAIVTDYERLERITDVLLISSLLVDSAIHGKTHLSLLARTCILVFCFKVKAVSEIDEQGQDMVVATIIPERSDFKAGRTYWRITPEGNGHSRIRMTGTIEPDFWIPPVIGPLLVRRKIIREAAEVIENIESLIAHE